MRARRQLLAALVQAQPKNEDLARKALAEAIGAGRMDLAMKLVRSVPPQKLSSDARILMIADEVRRRRPERAFPWMSVKGDNGDLSFLTPLLTAWMQAERNNLDEALRAIDETPANSLLGPLRAEQRALILLKFRRTADAEPFARRAIGQAGARETRLRLALADGFLAAGDKARAAIMVDGMGNEGNAARQRILAGKSTGQAIDSLPKALGESLTAFAADLARMQRITAADRAGPGRTARRPREQQRDDAARASARRAGPVRGGAGAASDDSEGRSR